MELLTVAETAKLLKVSPLTVRRHIAAGRLPAVKVGKSIRIHQTDVEHLLSPIAPRRVAHATDEQGGDTAERARLPVAALSEREKQQILAALEEAKRVRAKERAQRGGMRYRPQGWELLNEARDQRSRERS